MISSKIIWISVMASIAIVASVSAAENALASIQDSLFINEEEAVEAGNATTTTMMANQTTGGNMTDGTNSTS